MNYIGNNGKIRRIDKENRIVFNNFKKRRGGCSMKKYIFFLALIFIFFTVSLSFAAPIGKITQVQGRVDVLKTGKNMVAPVSLGAPVDIGDIYRAKTNSKAEITFINKNILRIAPATKIEIKEYMAEGNRSSAVMRLHRGRVQAISG
ncbi:MAG: FecR domain-containing protein, partial [Proteobacteria bacterium]|nr:FecR domain-containing protein [Pseudomonadota bacterium]